MAQTAKEQPRQKGGRFGTSAAAAKRKAQGLNPTISAEVQTQQRANAYAQTMPGTPPELRLKAAETVQAFTSLPVAVQIAAAGPKGALSQTLKRVMAQKLIEESLPDAVKLLVDLVKGRGKLARAPASVRRQAAVDLLTLGKVSEGSASGKDLSEMTADELQAFISQTQQELNARPELAKEIEGERIPDIPSAPTPSRFNDLDLS